MFVWLHCGASGHMKLLSSDAIRRCLVAGPGKAVISADYDQIELRIIGALAGEQAIIQAAKDGVSIHKITAEKVFGPNYTPDEYRYTKNLGFGWAFGGGAKTLAEQTGLPIDRARALIADYETAYPALKAFKKRETEAVLHSALTPNEYKTLKYLRNQLWHFRDTPEGRKAGAATRLEIKRLTHRRIGYCTTPYGRRLPVDASKAYAAINYKVQSTARDVLGDGLLRIMDDPDLEPTVVLVVHDELLGLAPIDRAEEYAQRYGELMTTEFEGVPLTAEGKVYGQSWGHGYSKQ